MLLSIIIPTRNRADTLSRTLASFDGIAVPAGVRPEILVVDNGSTDHTAAVVRSRSTARIPVRYVTETTPGVSSARNAGIAAAKGEIMLFIDDDVIPAGDWLEQMGRPLLERECDGAGGRVELSKELLRPWMTGTHNGGLACFDGPGDRPMEFLSSNMGIHRSVLDRVPGFDAELGPGARVGCFEDSLFSWQLVEAGFKVCYLPQASVLHCPDVIRLRRRHILSCSRMFGAGWGYILYHWRHEAVPFARLRYGYFALKLRLRRRLQPPPSLDVEGIPLWEMSYVHQMETCRQFLIERRGPRKYAKRGLRKLSHSA